MNSSGWKGVGYSVAVAVLVPLVVPVVVRASGPLARAMGKTGIALYEKGREMAAEMGEVIDDLVAETKAEFAASAVALDDSVTLTQPDPSKAEDPDKEPVG
jgi:hypothetical protein